MPSIFYKLVRCNLTDPRSYPSLESTIRSEVSREDAVIDGTWCSRALGAVMYAVMCALASSRSEWEQGLLTNTSLAPGRLVSFSVQAMQSES